jgi:hypothetical protein
LQQKLWAQANKTPAYFLFPPHIVANLQHLVKLLKGAFGPGPLGDQTELWARFVLDQNHQTAQGLHAH